MVMHYDLWHRALQCTKESSNRLMLKFVAYRTKKPGSCILKYNRLAPFELAFFTDQSMDDLSNNPLLDFLNKNVENLTGNQKPPSLPDHFDEKVKMNFLELQGDEKWKVQN